MSWPRGGTRSGDGGGSRARDPHRSKRSGYPELLFRGVVGPGRRNGVVGSRGEAPLIPNGTSNTSISLY